MTKIAFIVNPHSGRNRRTNRLELIRRAIPTGIDYDILLWDQFEQREDLFRQVRTGDYTIIAAVGGDGTVNNVAAEVNATDKIFAIIPFGSGNGLARHLNIPLDPQKAIQLLATKKTLNIDSCYINEKTFFCTAGVGFDAHVGKIFAASRSRGIAAYAGITLKQIRSFKPTHYKLTIDGNVSEHEAFLITFANAAQYGGNAYIAPFADISDGIINISIIRPFPLLKGLPLAYRMFNKSLSRSRDVEMLNGKHIILERENSGPVHYDGEPDIMGNRLEITIKPGTLKVLVP